MRDSEHEVTEVETVREEDLPGQAEVDQADLGDVPRDQVADAPEDDQPESSTGAVVDELAEAADSYRPRDDGAAGADAAADQVFASGVENDAPEVADPPAALAGE